MIFLFLEKTWRVPVLDAMGRQVLDDTGKAKTIDFLRSKIGPTAPHWTNLATFAMTALVMIVGSMLKPAKQLEVKS